jgi:hypothetical protein
MRADLLPKAVRDGPRRPNVCHSNAGRSSTVHPASSVPVRVRLYVRCASPYLTQKPPPGVLHPTGARCGGWREASLGGVQVSRQRPATSWKRQLSVSASSSVKQKYDDVAVPRNVRVGSWLCENAKTLNTLNRDRRSYSSKTVLRGSEPCDDRHRRTKIRSTDGRSRSAQ